MNKLWGLLAALISVIACQTAENSTNASEDLPRGILFDDFNYSDSEDPSISGNGWIVRSGSGGPGAPGVRWETRNVSFPTLEGVNQAMEMTTSTQGTGASTSQAEFYTGDQKFLEGTYAARVYFTDGPVEGSPDGDQIVETFFSITDLAFDMDPDYCEIDFEYLANGGWGSSPENLWNTTWETYRPDPWEMDAESTQNSGSLEGWHILMFTVSEGVVNYYLDGELTASHGGHVYPETPMSIRFNLWIINDGFAASEELRHYKQQVDWVFHGQNRVLSHQELLLEIEALRMDNSFFVDTVQ